MGRVLIPEILRPKPGLQSHGIDKQTRDVAYKVTILLVGTTTVSAILCSFLRKID